MDAGSDFKIFFNGLKKTTHIIDFYTQICVKYTPITIFIVSVIYKKLGLGSNVGHCRGRSLCLPNGGNHRGLPLQKMADLMIKPKNYYHRI